MSGKSMTILPVLTLLEEHHGGAACPTRSAAEDAAVTETAWLESLQYVGWPLMAASLALVPALFERRKKERPKRTRNRRWIGCLAGCKSSHCLRAGNRSKLNIANGSEGSLELHSSSRRLGMTQRQVIIFWRSSAGCSCWRRLRPRGCGGIGASRRNVAAEAKEYLRERNVKPLNVDLDTLLAESREKSLPTLAHPLLNQPAPSFELSNHNAPPAIVVGASQPRAGRRRVLLRLLLQPLRQPVVCVAGRHREVSRAGGGGDGDQCRHAAANDREVREVWPVHFPVLSDPDNKTAEAFSIYAPASEGKKERLLARDVCDR